jgi:hypothetical protein
VTAIDLRARPFIHVQRATQGAEDEAARRWPGRARPEWRPYPALSEGPGGPHDDFLLQRRTRPECAGTRRRCFPFATVFHRRGERRCQVTSSLVGLPNQRPTRHRSLAPTRQLLARPEALCSSAEAVEAAPRERAQAGRCPRCGAVADYDGRVVPPIPLVEVGFSDERSEARVVAFVPGGASLAPSLVSSLQPRRAEGPRDRRAPGETRLRHPFQPTFRGLDLGRIDDVRACCRPARQGLGFALAWRTHARPDVGVNPLERRFHEPGRPSRADLEAVAADHP